MNTAFDKEIRLKLLKLLQQEPELTQREMNQKMGVSLGKINYCLSALIQKGMIKVERFKNSKNKSACIYQLTPLGLEELAALTIIFLKIKIREIDTIKKEIKSLFGQVWKINPEVFNDPDLLETLKNKN
ncbi:MAG: MarR family EPS-associated transcriptional regulator [Desulfobacula sp.]|jgi:EPS-associated MarR family transcriptional regulator|nr:MarR family EPS-associated transcriptional regulator [Desulfobacula sp.]